MNWFEIMLAVVLCIWMYGAWWSYAQINQRNDCRNPTFRVGRKENPFWRHV